MVSLWSTTETLEAGVLVEVSQEERSLSQKAPFERAWPGACEQDVDDGVAVEPEPVRDGAEENIKLAAESKLDPALEAGSRSPPEVWELSTTDVALEISHSD